MNAAQHADDLMQAAFAERAADLAKAAAASLICVMPIGAPQFESVQDAAAAGIHAAMQLKYIRSYEAAGIVYSCGKAFGYTTPKSTASRGAWRVALKLPADSTLAGLFHTHPGRTREVNQFSETDVAQQRARGVPSFIGVVETGEIRVLLPVQRITTDTAHGTRVDLGAGS